MIAALHAFADNLAVAAMFATPPCVVIAAFAYAYRRQLAAFDHADHAAGDSIGRGNA